MLKIAKQMVTIHVKLVHVAYHQHTKPSYLFVCPCVPTLHKALNQKKQERRSTCCYFLMLLLLLEMLLSSLLLPWEGPPPQVQPRLLCCRYVAKVSFLFFGKERVQGGKRKRPLILFFSFLVLP